MARRSTIHDVIDALEEALSAAEELADGSENEIGGGKTAAVDAINAIRRGDTTEAITILEREFLPQWEDVAGCEAAYKEAMKQ